MQEYSLLISKIKLQDRTILGGNLDFDFVLPHVYVAQDLDLVPVLGQALMDDLMAKVKDEDENGTPISTEDQLLLDRYITPFLANAIIVRSLPSLAVKLVDSGVVQRIVDDGTPMSMEDIKNLVMYYETVRDPYKQQLIDYLCYNSNLYPKFKESKTWELGPSDYNYNLGIGLTGSRGEKARRGSTSGGSSPSGGTFISLTDTPDSYSGQAGRVPIVKGTEDGLEFIILSGGGNLLSDGSIPMDPGYVPANDQDIATKKYVDDNAGGSGVQSVTGPSVDNTDPANPVVNAQVVSVVAGSNVSVNNADPANPVVSASSFTDAGVIDRSYLTAEEETTTQGTFYLASREGKGSIPEAQQVVVNNDNQTQFFGQDVISALSATTAGVIRNGNYSGFLSCEVDSNNGEQRFQIEAYLTDDQGTPIDSGVTGQPVGDLGVRPVAVLDSGIVDMQANNETQINVSGFLSEDVEYSVGARIRYHVSATKVGTQGGNVTISLYYGSDHNSFIEVPATADSDDIVDNSKYNQLNVTQALNETINWIPIWVPGLYPRHTMTVDGDWTMISNKETADRPAPQASGDPEDAIPDNISWTVQTDPGYIATGNQYTFTSSGWMLSVDVYIPNTGAQILNQAFVIDVTGGGSEIIKDLIIPPTFQGPGWIRLDLNRVVESGSVIQVGLISQNNADETENFNHPWLYNGSSQNQDPTDGGWNHNNNNSILRIHELDENLIDRSADLAAIAEGDLVRMTGNGKEWVYRANGPGVLVGDVYIFADITLISTAGTFSLLESVDVSGSTPGTALTDYVENAGYWVIPGNQPSFATALGFIETSAGGGLVTNNDAYCGSIRFQAASASPDWDYVAFYQSGSGISGGQYVQLQGAYSNNEDDLVADLVNPVWDKRIAQGFICSEWRFDQIKTPVGGATELDVHKNGVSIYSNRPTISAGEFISSGGVFVDSTSGDFSEGDLVEIYITDVASTDPGKKLKGEPIGILK